MDKSADAFRTISEVAEELDLPQHVLRFWETRFPHIKPLKRAGGRRFYRPNDIEILRAIRRLLYSEGYTIKGVQRILKEQGPRSVIAPGFAAPENSLQSRSAASLAAAMERASVEESDDSTGPISCAPSNEASVFSMQGTDSRPDAEGAPAVAKTFAQSSPSRVEAIERLKSILRDLEDCERMLHVARSR